MAAVSVFVDDAIQGRLPSVCAKTGEPTDLIIRIRQPVGNGLNGAAWLLVFFGPPGWLAFFVVGILSSGQEYLTVRIPQTDAAYSRERLLERTRLATVVLGFATLAYGIVQPGMFPALWLAVGVTFLLAGVALHVMVWRQNVGVSLDASRRWVTLSGVHPAFVEAVKLHQVGARRS